MTNKTTLTAEAGVPIIRIERIFDASRDAVFSAFTQEEKLKKWWGQRDEARVDELDARPGGAWKFTDVSADGYEVTFYGYFHEVAAPERIVQTAEFAGIPERGHAVLDRYEFTELSGGRTLMTLTEAFLNIEDRDMAIENNMEKGVVQQYINIDGLLKEEE